MSTNIESILLISGLVLASTTVLPFLLAKLKYNQIYGFRRKRVPKDFTVVITGCDSGIGRITAEKMDHLGYKVLAGCLTKEGLDSIQKSCSSKLVPFILDVSNDEHVQLCAELVQKECPDGLFALVNNAGIRQGAYFEWNDINQMKKELDVNYFGAVRMTKALLPSIIKAQGRIVSVGSVASFAPVLLNSGYVASKHALYGLMSTLQQELSPFNVDVVVIAPNGMNTGIVDSQFRQYNERWEVLSPEIKARYGEERTKEMLEFLKKGSKGVETPNIVRDDIIKACTTSKPKPIYYSGRGSWLATVFPWLSGLIFSFKIPDRLPNIHQ